MGSSVAQDLQSVTAIDFRTRLTYRYTAGHARVEWVAVAGAESTLKSTVFAEIS